MRILCIIPVRGGSKGLPRKNAKEIREGISLLEWTIRQAHAVYPKDDVIVSTEDPELAGIAKVAGARVLDRPAELASDETTTAAVVDDILQRLDPEAVHFDAIAILQVTSPLRDTGDISRSIEMMRSGAYDSVVSAYETMKCHPAKLYFLDQTGAAPVAIPVAPELQHARRQDLPAAFRRNGAIFITTRRRYAQTGQLWGGRTGLVIMPQKRSIDIDAASDLEQARQLLDEATAGPRRSP